MWMKFQGAKKKSDRPLTPAEEKHRYEIWQRWVAQGKKLTPGHWNMASACVRAYSSYPRDLKWSKRLRAFKSLAAAKRVLTRQRVDWFDPDTGKQRFAFGLADPVVAGRKGGQKTKALREQRLREESGGKLKHYIPE